MLARTVLYRTTATPFALTRSIRTTPRLLVDAAKGGLSQGHVNHSPKSGPEFGKEKDVQSAAAGATKRSGGEVVSEASNSVAKEAERQAGTANQAAQSGSFQSHRGGVDGVGSSGSSFGQNGTSTEGLGEAEEASAPSVFGKIKQGLGLGTTKEEHQESKSGPGGGIPNKTSAGQRQYSTFSAARRLNTRSFSTTALRRAGETDAASKDGQGPREPAHQDGKLGGDQSAHLKHKSAKEADSGKGNASPNPSLPSHSRSFSTSTRSLTPSEADRSSTSSPSTASKRDGESVTGKVNEDHLVGGKGGGEGIRKKAQEAKVHGEGEAGPNASIPSASKARPSQAPGSGTGAPTRL